MTISKRAPKASTGGGEGEGEGKEESLSLLSHPQSLFTLSLSQGGISRGIFYLAKFFGEKRREGEKSEQRQREVMKSLRQCVENNLCFFSSSHLSFSQILLFFFFFFGVAEILSGCKFEIFC